MINTEIAIAPPKFIVRLGTASVYFFKNGNYSLGHDDDASEFTSEESAKAAIEFAQIKISADLEIVTV